MFHLGSAAQAHSGCRKPPRPSVCSRMGAWLPEGSSLFDPITWICNGTLFLRRNNTARNVFLSARVPVADASLSASSGMVISALSATLSKIKRAMLTRSRFMSRRSSQSWWTEGYAIRHGSRMPTLSALIQTEDCPIWLTALAPPMSIMLRANSSGLSRQRALHIPSASHRLELSGASRCARRTPSSGRCAPVAVKGPT